MPARDYKDIVGGALLVGIGGFMAAYAGTSYSLGAIRQIGPGMFPVALGIILVGLGILLLVPALFRSGEMPSFELLPFLSVVAGIAGFAMAIEPLGLVPSIVILAVVSTLADPRLTILKSLMIAAVLATMCAVIFRYGLGISLQLAKWPF